MGKFIECKIYGTTGNPDDIIITANLGSGQWFVIKNATVSFKHLTLNRNYFAWRRYFSLISTIFTLENVKIAGPLGGTMYPIVVGNNSSTINVKNVDYLNSPYALIEAYPSAYTASINMDSLYVPGYNVEYYGGGNFTFGSNDHSNDSSTYGTSQYDQSSIDWPCGYN